MRKFLKKVLSPILQKGFKIYTLKPRTFTYESITVVVHPEVFSPRFTISTKLLLDFIKPLNLENKTILELGCGSGIIALYAASKGADVTASDINPIATNALRVASIKNNLNLTVIDSDLFNTIPNQQFDYIIINPPYYPNNPKNIKESAWYCGENYEYFNKLFQQLNKTLAKNTIMILSEDCNIEYIKSLAFDKNLKLVTLVAKTILKERNFIFNIELY